MRLLLARHGQTEANVKGALSSLPPGGPLTELGRAQAAALGDRLAREPVEAVYASRAIRAQQTAAPVAAAHGLEVAVLDGVHEVFVGELEGRHDEHSRAVFGKVYQSWWSGDLDVRMPGGESATDLHSRFQPAVDAIAASGMESVVLVSHGAAIRVMAAVLVGVAAESRYVPNGGLVVLRGGPAGWSLESWDEAVAATGDVTAGGPAD